jgi:chromosome segregation ATPase
MHYRLEHILITYTYSQAVRRDIKRLHDDIDLSRRQIQAVENNIRDFRENLLNCQHKLDFKVGVEMQLKEYEENLKEHIEELKVNIKKRSINEVHSCSSILTFCRKLKKIYPLLKHKLKKLLLHTKRPWASGT